MSSVRSGARRTNRNPSWELGFPSVRPRIRSSRVSPLGPEWVKRRCVRRIVALSARARKGGKPLIRSDSSVVRRRLTPSCRAASRSPRSVTSAGSAAGSQAPAGGEWSTTESGGRRGLRDDRSVSWLGTHPSQICSHPATCLTSTPASPDGRPTGRRARGRSTLTLRR